MSERAIVLTCVPFHIRSWGAWGPGRETPAAWLQWAERLAAEPITLVDPVPMLLRRRVSALGQKALKAAWSLPDSTGARMVFCSRHGEFGRTLSILDSLGAGTEVSPADFTLSVHNALAGLLSIARSNRHGHTMIAAGTESFGFGMLEALACLAERPEQPVLLVHFDEPLPAPFDVFDQDAPEPIALAMVLTAADGERFALTTYPAGGALEAPEPAVMAFMRVMLGIEQRAVTTGEQLVWHWQRDDAAD